MHLYKCTYYLQLLYILSLASELSNRPFTTNLDATNHEIAHPSWQQKKNTTAIGFSRLVSRHWILESTQPQSTSVIWPQTIVHLIIIDRHALELTHTNPYIICIEHHIKEHSTFGLICYKTAKHGHGHRDGIRKWRSESILAEKYHKQWSAIFEFKMSDKKKVCETSCVCSLHTSITIDK